jgi:hypothetical protein
MKQHSRPTPGKRRRFADAIALALLAATTSCAPPTQAEFETQFFGQVDYRDDIPAGEPVLRPEGFVCKEAVWRGPKTSAAILARPILGLYADGRKLAVPDANNLTKNDLAPEIDRHLGVSAGPRSVEKATVNNNFDWMHGEWLEHSSRDYSSDTESKSSHINGRRLLHEVVRVMGVPRYAENPHCGATLALYYGEPASFLSEAPVGNIVNQAKLKCRFGDNFLIIQISLESFSVTSPSGCKK